MIELPSTPYKWQEWDCFALANWLRSQANLKPLPSLNWLYRHYTEETLPPMVVSRILRHYAIRKIGEISDWDLVCLRFGSNPEGLGTVVNSGIVFMSFDKGGVWMPLTEIQSRVFGAWKYY